MMLNIKYVYEVLQGQEVFSHLNSFIWYISGVTKFLLLLHDYNWCRYPGMVTIKLWFTQNC